MCNEASNEFLIFLGSFADPEPLIEHFEPNIEQDCLDYPYDLQGCSYHWAVRLGEYVVDWTARQFDAGAPFPLIWKCPKREWRNV